MVFPELGISAYSIDDLLLQDALLGAVETALLTLAEGSRGLRPVFAVGAPLRFEGRLFNTAVVIHDGQILGVTPKTFLPNYREYYERRWFASGRGVVGRTIEIGGHTAPFGTDLLFRSTGTAPFTFHTEICEDVWTPEPPSTGAALAGAEILLNLSASNIVIGKAEARRMLCASQAMRCQAVYAYSAADCKRTLLYRNDKGYALGAISRDARYLAVVKSRTTSDADIYLVDRRTGTTKNITKHSGSVNNAPADFSPDGRRLLFVSDAGREFASLRSFDVATGATATVYEQPWDVLGADYSKGGRYLTVYVNDDSRNAARILDAKTFAPVPLQAMPQGLVRGVSISPNDSAFAFYATDGSVPNELYVTSFGATPRRLTNALDERIHRRDLVVPTVTRFTSYDGVTVPGVLYRPHQASPAAKAPAVVLVHGGPGGQAQVGYSALVQSLVNHGYVVFDINNRGSSGYGKTFYAMDDRKHGEADLGDVIASKRLLIETGYVDSARIGIMGGSYGGYMTLAAVTLQPDAFKTGVDLFGISNWSRTLTNIPPWWAAFREALYAEMGDPKTDSVRLHRISPLFHASRITAPLMVLQGANDPRVLKVESDEIVAAARRNGVPVEYVVFPDEGHGFLKKENEISGYSKVIAFLDTYLKGSPRATVVP